MTQDPLGRIVANILALERLANTVANASEGRIQRLFERIVEDLHVIDPTAPSRVVYRRQRLEKFIRRVRERVKEFGALEERELRGALSWIGRQQAKYAERTLIATLGSIGERAVRRTPITQQRVRAILTTDPFQGRLLSEWVEGLTNGAYARVRDQVRMGLVAEESLPDLVRRIRGSQAGYVRRDPQTGAFVPRGTKGAIVQSRFVGGALSTTTRGAEALVRTAVTHISSMGALATYEENADLIRAIRYAAFLDDRTTTICLSLDGTEWAPGSPEIVIPGRDTHINCRSVLVPEPDWAKLGLEAPPDGTRASRDLSEISDKDLDRKISARRRTGDLGKIKQVPSHMKASEWLRSQPVRIQEKLLGKGKAKLFREGKVTLADLVRQDLTTVPLRELVAA